MSRINKLVLVIVLAAVLLMPLFSIQMVPEWRLQVLDQDGVPVQNEMIRQTWKDYSLEFWTLSGHEETTITDTNGYVIFPPRSIRVSVLEILASKFRDIIARLNPHSSFGPASSVFCVNRINCEAYFRNGEQPPSSVVVGSPSR